MTLQGLGNLLECETTYALHGQTGSNMPLLSDTPLATPLSQLLTVIDFLNAQGWTPATSSNFSCRIPDEDRGFLITVSGKDKGALSSDDFLAVGWDGRPLIPGRKPSAETHLHRAIYEAFPEAKTILHCHSVNATVFSKLYESDGGVWLSDFEILKAFESVQSHEEKLWLPILPNSQDMMTLADKATLAIRKQDRCFGFLLAGHGLYAWGDSPAQARRHVEAFEFLFDCLLKLRSLNAVEVMTKK